MFQAPAAQTPAAPTLPPEYAQQRAPDAGAVTASSTRRTEDRVRSGTDTVLTSGSGVLTENLAETEKKTLLGA